MKGPTFLCPLPFHGGRRFSGGIPPPENQLGGRDYAGIQTEALAKIGYPLLLRPAALRLALPRFVPISRPLLRLLVENLVDLFVDRFGKLLRVTAGMIVEDVEVCRAGKTRRPEPKAFPGQLSMDGGILLTSSSIIFLSLLARRRRYFAAAGKSVPYASSP